jgi:isopentenyl phosphate kinase
METLVVKFGGSVITRKKETSALRPKVLTRLAVELKNAWEKGGHPPLVVIHGAGSYGHPWAKKWDLNHPPPSPRNGRNRGAAITGYHVRMLHVEVLRALLDAGLPAQSFPPLAIARNDKGKFASLEISPFREALTRGTVPVTCGDVVPDTSWEFSILSGDTIMLELSRKLPAKRAVFVSDVDGFLEPDDMRTVIPRVTEEALSRLKADAKVPDVTGGIVGKAAKMVEMGALGVHAGLINGLRVGRLERAVGGEEVYGSWT